MAKRYRYAFARKTENKRGRFSLALAGVSCLLFVAAVITDLALEGRYPAIVGSIALFALLLSAYGFVMGLAGFSDANRRPRPSIVGSILNGVILVAWIALYLMGTR